MCGIMQRVQQNNKKDTICYVISGFCHKVADNCTLLGYSSVSSGNFLEIKEMTTTHVITQKSVVLKQYFIFKKPVLRTGSQTQQKQDL